MPNSSRALETGRVSGLSGPRRAAVFLSGLWLFVAAVLSRAYGDSFAAFVGWGGGPLALLWGAWWVAQGFRRS